MNEEKYIREKMGTRNPFTVPEGYFDQLAEQIINRLPAEAGESGANPKYAAVGADSSTGSKYAAVGATPSVCPPSSPAIVRYLRPLLYAAACAVLAIAVGIVFRNSTDVSPDQYVAHHQETNATYSDTYIEEMADYAMLDNEDIYASLLADL